MPQRAMQMALAKTWASHDVDAYMVQEGECVSDILMGMLGPPCDENRDARQQLQLKTQELHAKDPAKAAMKVEVWVFKGDGTMWVNTTSVIKYIYTGSFNNISRTLQSIFARALVPHKLLKMPQYAGDPKPKHVYLTDMNDLYHVAVRMNGWEFMAEASHINAKKAVRGLAADLQEFHAQAQDNSAAQLMQQGAAAGEAAAQITSEQHQLELAERRHELKRKVDDWDLSMKERQMSQEERQMSLHSVIEQKKLDNTHQWISLMEKLDPNWRQDKRLQLQAKDRLCTAHLITPLLTIAHGVDGTPRLESASLSVSEVVESLRTKNKITGKIDSKMPQRAGVIAAQLYREKHGQSPSKHDAMIEGEVREVNSYTEADRDMIEQAVMRAATGGSCSIKNFLHKKKV